MRETTRFLSILKKKVRGLFPSICICGRMGKSIGRINDYTQTINSNQMKIPLIDSETLKLLNVCKKFAGNKKPN